MENKPKYILILTVLIFSLSFCTSKNNLTKRDQMTEDKIIFEGNNENKDYIIILLDEILKVQGDFGVYGNLSFGIADILKSNIINIQEENNLLNVSIYPISGQGHDFNFTIDIDNKKLRDLVVGEIEPEPDIEE